MVRVSAVIKLMKTVAVPTFTATIWIGTKNRDTGGIISNEEILASIQSFVDGMGQCVSVTPTTFVYKNGNEPGLAIGFINYPRFPATAELIFETAEMLARQLKELAAQYKVTIVCPDRTIMLSTEPA